MPVIPAKAGIQPLLPLVIWAKSFTTAQLVKPESSDFDFDL